MATENSGLSCSYYEIGVDEPHLFHRGKTPYTAECGEIMSALNMTIEEQNIFKELFRTAAARKGKEKEGNNPLRAAEKIVFFANRIHHKAKFYAGVK